MRKFVALGSISAILLTMNIAIAAPTIKIKNCLNIKSGAARLVSETTKKCKKNEKLVNLEVPSPEIKNGADGATILSGTTDPKPELGKIGDVYIDTKFRWMYGPKTADGWGLGFSILGGGGGGGQGPKGDPGTNGTNGTNGFIPKYGWFYDMHDRIATATNTTMPLLCSSVTPCETTGVGEQSKGVTFNSNDGTVRVDTLGTYNIAFSSQVYNDGAVGATISLWVQKKLRTKASWDATDNMAWTNTDVDIVKKDLTGRKILAWNFFIPIDVTEEIRLVWQTTATGLYINSAPANTLPGIPGTILTVNQVG